MVTTSQGLRLIIPAVICSALWVHSVRLIPCLWSSRMRTRKMRDKGTERLTAKQKTELGGTLRPQACSPVFSCNWRLLPLCDIPSVDHIHRSHFTWCPPCQPHCLVNKGCQSQNNLTTPLWRHRNWGQGYIATGGRATSKTARNCSLLTARTLSSGCD